MSIFSKIRDAIFNRKPAETAGASAPGASTGSTGGAPGTPGTAGTPYPTGAGPTATATTPVAPAAASAPAPAAPAPAMQQVDVEAILTQMSSNAGQQLNWRTSIVDLMKLLGMQSSLDERRELAQELGYTGSTSDTATMNIWLHKQVMKKLSENGGKVPADLLD